MSPTKDSLQWTITIIKQVRRGEGTSGISRAYTDRTPRRCVKTVSLVKTLYWDLFLTYDGKSTKMARLYPVERAYHLSNNPGLGYEFPQFILELNLTTCFLFWKEMNTVDYKYQWGGEDWDLLDRVLNAHLEVERIKHPGLYHHYQSKQRSWN